MSRIWHLCRTIWQKCGINIGFYKTLYIGFYLSISAFFQPPLPPPLPRLFSLPLLPNCPYQIACSSGWHGRIRARVFFRVVFSELSFRVCLAGVVWQDLFGVPI